MRVKSRFTLGFLAAVATVAAIALPQDVLAGNFQGPEGAVSSNYTFTTRHNHVSGASVISFARDWQFSLLSGNSDVTNATISVNSGYAASKFVGVTSFPVLQTQASLPAGTSMQLDLRSSIVTRTTTGFDSGRTIIPRKVRSGGGQQTVTITVDLTNARYAPGGVLTVTVPMDIAGETGSCGTTTAPTGTPNSAVCFVNPDGSVQWNTCISNCTGSLGLNNSVDFTVLLTVPNTSSQPIVHIAPANVSAVAGGIGGLDTCTAVAPATSFTAAVPSLDGRTAGSGSASFSMDQTNPLGWLKCPMDVYNVVYTRKLA